MTTVDQISQPFAGAVAVDPTAVRSLRRISWAAVFAGMVMAVVVQLVLALIGAGFGLSTLEPVRYNSPGAMAIGIGAGVWWVVSSVIALFVGGWISGHLSATPDRTGSVLHGLLTWGLATLVTVYLIASLIGSVLSGGAAVVSKTADVAAAGAGAVAAPAVGFAREQLASSGITLESMKAQVQELLAQTGKPALQPAAVSTQASSAAGQLSSGAASAGSSGNSPVADLQATLQKIIASGKETIDQADREAVVNVVVARTGATRAEAEQRTDAWITQYQNAKAQFAQKRAEAEVKARQVADDAASATSKGALGAAVALILGAIAAAVGGMVARRRVVFDEAVVRTGHPAGVR
jgi:hypothetical protein